ncbi:hypothetical protein [Hymenobacter bucti]|uniref:Uncharacterized protein n=1 Tax=Hymenobacter bucti TaxID=1844114 RepID=A0ABW4QNL5_9BACT
MPHPVFQMTRPALGVGLLCYLLLLIGLPARAQTPLGQPSLDESKVQVWCATVRYVYEDAGRPNLKRTLRCEGNLGTLAASLRPDSLRVYSLLYAPIEERGRIYKGLKDNPARLAALTKAIITRLKSSPSRQRDPARLARLQGLEKKLNDYVQTGLPPGREEDAPTADTTARAATGLAEAAEASAPGTLATRADAPAAEPVLNRFFAPLALILSIVSLVLFALLRMSMSREIRQMQRMTSLASELSPAQQRQVEELIARRVAEALRERESEQPG